MSRISLSSGLSRDTFLDPNLDQEDPTISFIALLDVIRRHRSLHDAHIVRVDSYKKNGLARHHFIVLQLEREGRRQIWLRIDRRRDEKRSLVHFTVNGGTPPANDRVAPVSFCV